MKENICAIFAVIALAALIGHSVYNNAGVPSEKTVYVPVKDTIVEKENIARILELEHTLALTRDSLQAAKDSLGTDLFVANYKLARIKKYADIAAKGNNIKYLRGWIYRAIKD